MRISGEIDFPPASSVLDIFYFVKDGNAISFYVGEAASFHVRMTDFIRKHAQQISTWALQPNTLEAKATNYKERHWQANNRAWEESQTILELPGMRYPLLNNQLGYKCDTYHRPSRISRSPEGETGRPSIDPELLLRILLIGYLYGIASERKLGGELRMHLALALVHGCKSLLMLYAKVCLMRYDCTVMYFIFSNLPYRS